MVKYRVRYGFILRRRPRLRAIIRSRAFTEASARVTEWIEGQFSQVEQAVPGLTRAGQDIGHSCSTVTRSLGVMRGGILTAAPARLVTTVYAAPDDLTGPLAALRAALADQGWGGFGPSTDLVYRRPRPLGAAPAEPGTDWPAPPVRASWRPDGGRAMRTIRDASGREVFLGVPTLDAGWAGRKDPPGPVTALASTTAHGAQVTAMHRPVEYRRADIPALAARILEAGESVLAVRICVHYTVR